MQQPPPLGANLPQIGKGYAKQFDLELKYNGYACTNGAARVHRNQSPCQFYCRVANVTDFNKQLQILKQRWGVDLNPEVFLQHIRPSTLDRNVWLDCRHLKLVDRITIIIPNVNKNDIDDVIRRSLIPPVTSFTDGFEYYDKEFFSKVQYPTLEFDFLPLIKVYCQNRLPFKKYLLYYISAKPLCKTRNTLALNN
jgi:hypothetical protein